MLGTLLYPFWFAAPLVQAVIAWRMWARLLHREHPFFFLYTLFHVLTFPFVLYSYRLGNQHVYRVTYVTYEALDVLLKSGVIYELFARVFRPYQGIRNLGALLLRWGSVLLLLIALLAAISSPGSDSDKFSQGLYLLQRSQEIIQGGLLLLLFVASASLGLQWRQDTFGIALGFGIITSVSLVAFTLRMELGGSSTDLLSLVAVAGYDCATGLWLATLYARKAVHQFDQRIPGWDIEAWNRALLNLLRQ